MDASDFFSQYMFLIIMVGLVFLGMILLGIRYGKRLRFVMYSRIFIAGAVGCVLTKIVTVYQGTDQFTLVALIAEVLAVLAIYVLGEWTFHSVIIPMRLIKNNAEKMFKGDFAVSLQLKGNVQEFGELFKVFQNIIMVINEQQDKNRELAVKLASIAELLVANSEEISSSSENIASSQQQIARGASSQVTNITQTQQSLVELVKGIKRTNTKLDDIATISEILTQIADQTNILALNAAIEASQLVRQEEVLVS